MAVSYFIYNKWRAKEISQNQRKDRGPACVITMYVTAYDKSQEWYLGTSGLDDWSGKHDILKKHTCVR